MTKLILRWRGEGPMPDHVAERVRGLQGVELLDSSARMLRVEGDRAAVSRISDSEADVDLFEEAEAQHIAPPNLGIAPTGGPPPRRRPD